MADEKKKRGRKPKDKKINDAKNIKVPKKRGRKPKNLMNQEISDKKKKKEKSYSIENLSNINNEKNNENVILHLSVHSNQLENNNQVLPSEVETIGLNNNYADITNIDNSLSGNNILPSDNNLTQSNFSSFSVNSNETNIPNRFSQEKWNLNNTNTKISHGDNWFRDNNIEGNDNYFYDERFKKINNFTHKKYDKKYDTLLNLFKESNQRGVWPKYSPIYCFWCCHPFNCTPCALPIKYENDTFHVYGNFCSPECCASYNFNDCIDKEKKWERYSLLNMLYRKVYQDKNIKIKLANPRQSLNIFGGHLSINEFRELNENYDKGYKINFPPLIAIIPQQEEVTYDNEKMFAKKDNLFIPLDQTRVDTASENLKLKRNKPFADPKNTLEACMKLQFGK